MPKENHASYKVEITFSGEKILRDLLLELLLNKYNLLDHTADFSHQKTQNTENLL